MKDEIQKYVGMEGSILTRGDGGMRINVRVLDYKESYGKKRWLVMPLSGNGQTWTEQEPLPLIK